MNSHSDQAAARRRAARRKEEEELTSYTPTDMSEDWQFKIVRGDFTTHEAVDAVIREQAQFGWIFLEKFDNSRIRFKRPASEASNDRGRPGDPYATSSKVAGGCGCAGGCVGGGAGPAAAASSRRPTRRRTAGGCRRGPKRSPATDAADRCTDRDRRAAG